MKRLATTAVGLALAGGLTAGLEATSSTASPVRRTATVAGYVELCGGPAPGRCWKGKAGFCQPPKGCVTTRRVAVVDARGRRVAVQHLHRARFKFRLLPGHYKVELLGDGKHVHGQVMQTKRVWARAGRTTHVRFLFSVP